MDCDHFDRHGDGLPSLSRTGLMPLLLVPYTLGTFLEAAPGAGLSGGAYTMRRRRYLAYILTSFLLLVLR